MQGAAEELATIVAAALGWLQQRHELAAGRAALSRFEAHYPSLLAQAEAALAAVEEAAAQGDDDEELGWEEEDERATALEASAKRVDGLGARWRDRATERASHAAKGAQLEAEIGQLRARFGQLVSVTGPALDGGKVLLAGFDQLWQPAEAAHIALVARRHALAPLAPQPPQPQPQPEEARPPFSLYNEEAFIQGEDPCFSLVQPEGGAGGRLSEGGAADAAPCAYASADGAGAGFFVLKVCHSRSCDSR